MSWYPGKLLEDFRSKFSGQRELPLPYARRMFMDRIEEAIKDEEKAVKEYRELAGEAERLGYPSAISITLSKIAEDEARHKKNLESIKSELEKWR